MNKDHRHSLLQHRLNLVKDLEANDVISILFQNRVISENDRELISAEKTRRQRNEFLLDLLPRKGPKAYQGFVKALRESGYGYLGDLLEGSQTDADGVSGGTDSVDSPPSTNPPFSPIFPIRPRSASKREPDFLNAYSMSYNPRGWCLIINNTRFLTLSDRSGSDKDASNLQRLFSSLGFRVWTLKNLKSEDIRVKVKELSEKDHSTCDALVVCLLSHGVAGYVYGIDGLLVGVSEILNLINSGPSGKSLAGKPKLFLIQACRSIAKNVHSSSSEPSDSIDSSESISHPGNNKDSELPSPEIIPQIKTAADAFIEQGRDHVQADVLLGYSTFPGEVSWRNTAHGSFFIDALVEVFQENASWMDVLEMLVMVNARVLEKVSMYGERQIPAPVFTLLKKLYLLPTR